MKLSKRLETIKSMVPVSVVADIGADHGKLIISLAQEGLATHGFAVENKAGPYGRLVKAVEDAKLASVIDCSFSDGISALPDTVSTIIIAGMGGHLIVDILKKDIFRLVNVRTIIVDAHTEVPYLRQEVSKLGFSIVDEKMVEEGGKFYEIIKFVRADIAFLSDLDRDFGPVLRKEKTMTFERKYIGRIKEIETLMGNPSIGQKRLDELKSEADKIRSVL